VSKLVNLQGRNKYHPDVVGLACGKVTAARARLGLSRADFAIALSRLLGWSPSVETIELWEQCAAPPPGDVVAAADVLASQAGTIVSEAQDRDYVSVLIGHPKWNRDDLHELSASFDASLARASVDDIMRLTHVWLISETPQAIELSAGRRISDQLVSTVEHRVVQLRRADDFVAGSEAHALVRRELAATTGLLKNASYTQDQARRLLTAVGELAQLGAWVAADGDMYEAALGYVRGGVSAASAAGDSPLAANIISTLSYQIANAGHPHEAAVLARSAYAGAKDQATPITKALLMERIAWADAKRGDLQSCERFLGQVAESFSRGPRENDPDWVYWLNSEEIDVMAGRCFTELQIPTRAEPLLRVAISQYDQALIRENVLYLSWLAESYVQLDEIEQAAEVGTRALELAMHTGSARADDRVRRIASILERYKSIPKVGEFFDVYRDESADVDEGL
jgi:DNA-binding transcriptional regulator YiaG